MANSPIQILTPQNSEDGIELSTYLTAALQNNERTQGEENETVRARDKEADNCDRDYQRTNKTNMYMPRALLNGASAGLAYIASQGNVTATTIWFAITTGVTAGLSYYQERE